MVTYSLVPVNIKPLHITLQQDSDGYVNVAANGVHILTFGQLRGNLLRLPVDRDKQAQLPGLEFDPSGRIVVGG